MRRVLGRLFPVILGLALAASCSSPEEPDPTPTPMLEPPEPPKPPKPLPPLTAAPLTTEVSLVSAHAILSATLESNPALPAGMDAMLKEGFGDLKEGPGWAMVPSTLDDAPPPAPGKTPKRLTRFVHLADAQLADDESPARLASFDTPAIPGAYRPQEGHECRILNAAVRTINVVHQETPLDFVVLGGDNADNAQTNELGWFLSILDGAPSVECDSGKDDDPVVGPDNDPKDPFVAEGLKVPWLWVTGNHDVLNQGTFPVASRAEDVIGGYSSAGTRDWTQPGAPLVKDEVPADPRREFLTRASMLETIAKAGDGHTHVHRVTKTAPPGGHAYWELETSALADFPHQMRVIEVWDEDNGYLTIRGTALDYQVEGDPIAADGRSRSVVDLTSGWINDGSGAPDQRNVALWIKKPQ